MISHDSTIKDIIRVVFSNIISLISSILNGFVIPVILGTLNYGYYKIFALYASYTALCHLGFNDGILLSYGGTCYDNLDKYKFRSNSFFFVIFQSFVSLVIMLISLFSSTYLYKIIFILLGINSFFQNLLQYYQNISQTFMRFKEYSIVNMIQYVSLILSVLGILIYCKLHKLYNIGFIPYVFLIIFINVLLIMWYFYDYRDITFGPHLPLIYRIHDFKKYFVSGFYMTFGYGMSILIFNLDSQFVIKFFSVRTYGIYAFAYSMFSAGLTILGSAAVVLLPHLKQHSSKYILHRYSQNASYVILLVYLAISGYFLLKIIVYKFINEYYGSMVYFRLLLPGMVITCCVSTVISNYYYALKKGKFYFYLSLVVLLLSFFIDSMDYLIFKNPSSLAFSSTLSLLLWYMLSDYFLVKWYYVKFLKNLFYIILMMILFWIFSGTNNLFIGFSLYIITYIVISYLLFKDIIIRLYKRILRAI